MEGQLLPSADLKPAYGKAVWLYVYRDFSKSPADLAAERICLRLGMTAYPQHFLIDPRTLENLADTGRQAPSFLAAVEKAKVEAPREEAFDAAKRIREADARAVALEKSGSVGEATKALADGDVLVRYRAMEILAAKAPEGLVAKAADLLAVPNDPFRFLACEGLKKAGKPEAAKALEATLREPKGSLNPNVLRIRCAEALGTCGNEGSIAALRPYASSGEWNNGLTRISVEAVVAIAARAEKARAPAREALAASYPPPAADKAQERACLALAKTVHGALEKVTGRKVPFPDVYDEKARERLGKAWN